MSPVRALTEREKREAQERRARAEQNARAEEEAAHLAEKEAAAQLWFGPCFRNMFPEKK